MESDNEYQIFNCPSCVATYGAEQLYTNKMTCDVCKNKFDKNTICNSISNFLQTKYYILTMTDNENIYIYNKNEGIYERGEIIIHQEISNFEKIIQNNMPSEILYKIKCKTYTKREELNPSKYLIVNNCVFDLDNFKKLEHSHEFKATNKIRIDFDATKKCEKIDKFISEIVEEEYIDVIYEMIAYCLYPSLIYPAFYILQGEGGNGKSKLTDMIRKFLGGENVSSVSFQKINDGFQLHNLYGKKANIFQDLSAEGIKEDTLIKPVSAGDVITAEKKHKDSFDFRNTAKLIFSCNEIPQIKDVSDAFFRRLYYIPFPYTFDENLKDNPNYKIGNPKILEEITTEEELKGLLNKSLLYLKRIDKNKKLYYPLSFDEKKKLFDKKANPVKVFVETNFVPMSLGEISKAEIYDKYMEWCSGRGVAILDENPFWKKFKQFSGSKYIIGQTHSENGRVWCYKGIAYNPSIYGQNEYEKCNKNYGKENYKRAKQLLNI